mgnify:CR=1 FL=1
MIQVEQTPNPDSLKFLSQKILSKVGTEEFKKSNLNNIKIPFIKELLNFSGVELVLISSQIKHSKNGNIFILEMGKPVFIKDLAEKMIILSGKDTKNVKIKYTGLRKGEKLNEQLFFSEEKIEKTGVSGILCVSKIPFQTNMKKFDDFITKLNTIKKKTLVEEIIKMLPEYKRLS